MSINNHAVGAVAVLMIVLLAGVLFNVLASVDNGKAVGPSASGPVAVANLF